MLVWNAESPGSYFCRTSSNDRLTFFRIDKAGFMETNKNENIFQVNKEIDWQPAGPGIQRQIFGYGDQVMMVKVLFEKDAVGALHNHPHIQVSYVESGVFEVTIGGEKKTLRGGDGFYVPSNVEHGCHCLEAGVLIDVFTPQREDFLI